MSLPRGRQQQSHNKQYAKTLNKKVNLDEGQTVSTSQGIRIKTNISTIMAYTNTKFHQQVRSGTRFIIYSYIVSLESYNSYLTLKLFPSRQ